MIGAWRPGELEGAESTHNNGHAGKAGEEVEMHARCGADVGKLKKKLVRAEKNGGAGKRQEKRVGRVNLTTTIINHITINN
jgi:hypothetical protein